MVFRLQFREGVGGLAVGGVELDRGFIGGAGFGGVVEFFLDDADAIPRVAVRRERRAGDGKGQDLVQGGKTALKVLAADRGGAAVLVERCVVIGFTASTSSQSLKAPV